MLLVLKIGGGEERRVDNERSELREREESERRRGGEWSGVGWRETVCVCVGEWKVRRGGELLKGVCQLEDGVRGCGSDSWSEE